MGLFERAAEGAGVNLGCGGGVGASKTLPFFSPSSTSYSSRFLSSDILVGSARCPPKFQMATGNKSRSIGDSGSLIVRTGAPVSYVPEDGLNGELSDVKLVERRKCRNNLEVDEAGAPVGYGQAFSDIAN